jgi:hypothetical protein
MLHQNNTTKLRKLLEQLNEQNTHVGGRFF